MKQQKRHYEKKKISLLCTGFSIVKLVVDENCKVHGIDNLYMAGSSCFTTAGAANPTLTLIALTLRLSDHVKDKMKNKG